MEIRKQKIEKSQNVGSSYQKMENGKQKMEQRR